MASDKRTKPQMCKLLHFESTERRIDRGCFVKLSLTVSVGNLGLVVEQKTGEGVLVKQIQSTCTFKGKLHVGDRFIAVNGKYVNKIKDIQIGKNAIRTFGLLRRREPCPITYPRFQGPRPDETSSSVRHPPTRNYPIVSPNTSFASAISSSRDSEYEEKSSSELEPDEANSGMVVVSSETARKKRSFIEHCNEDVYARLQKSRKHGVGTFAIKDFKKGDELFKTIPGVLEADTVVLSRREIESQILHDEVKRFIYDMFEPLKQG